MNERSIFLEALDKDDPTQRSAFLDTACAGDDALRLRIEVLLQSHVEAGNFLGKLAPERIAEELAVQHTDAETQGEVPANEAARADLGFLTPTDKPGVLGQLAHYDILEVIGRGGMGMVLRAFDEKLHRVVAIKVMAAQLATNATARRRFTREAQAQAAVSHDHIVTIHAVEEAGALPYLVMQYVAGLSLQERLDRSGPLELQEILRIGMQMAAGLAAAHAQGLVHRDIKPANILLENGVERVKVADFGLARAATEASLTQSGVVAGTPQYMSPEQAEGSAIDQRTDLFSLGSVMYAMCTGRTPFRASGSMAILKRVCEETPTPIRETNPEIPDWLVAIVAKLHAKNPSQRYQSATEVAELLARHLAYVQHPSVVGHVSNVPVAPAARWKRAPRRRLALAAAVLVCFIAGLSLTEATGVSNVRGTVIRIFTPEGTLVVEVDDPGVKVTIEGDGGLVITGAGPKEVRLPPGSYKVHAERGGKRVLLERELVSIARGGREVVKVKLETPPAPVVAKTEKGTFVLLAAGKERKFDTLARAVQGASDGDTIEVRGNGPFVTPPLRLADKALVLRSGPGTRPVFIPSSEALKAGFLLRTRALLVLEGLEFDYAIFGEAAFGVHNPIWTDNTSPLFAAHCRIVGWGSTRGIHAADSQQCEVRHCEILLHGGHAAVAWHPTLGNRLLVDGCTIAGSALNLYLGYKGDPIAGGSVQFTRNSVACGCAISISRWRADQSEDRHLSLTVTDNAVAGQEFLFLVDYKPVPEQTPATAETILKRLVAYKDQRNVCDSGTQLLAYQCEGGNRMILNRSVKDLESWQRFWGLEGNDSVIGQVRFQGWPVAERVVRNPHGLTPADFRLRPDSAGHRAGKDGKDVGADVDLVGPGPAYERWKKTPEYQQWLKETGQRKK